MILMGSQSRRIAPRCVSRYEIKRIGRLVALSNVPELQLWYVFGQDSS